MAVVIGISGVRRNAAVALCESGHIAAVCEQERVTRTRGVGIRDRGFPREALDCVLALARRTERDIDSVAVAEPGIEVPGIGVERFDHHFGHAATAFWTSPFSEATIIVCDGHAASEVSVWRGGPAGLERCEFPWRGPGPAAFYSDAAAAFGFERAGEEHRLEALARLGSVGSADAIETLAPIREDGLTVHPEFAARIAGWVGRNGTRAPLDRCAEVAGGIQQHVGRLLAQTIARIKASIGGSNLCVAGGLFYNSYLTTCVAQSSIYERVFVPVNPGNAGVSVGAALAVGGTHAQGAHALSPYLGPEYSPDEIKAVLDNCKLSYEYLHNGRLFSQTVDALAKGQLVGWFQGRMEWGPRALGNRSILASPVAPYALENLNRFLKHREPHRSYSVSVCEEDAPRYFEGPAASPFMEFEYNVRDQGLFRTLLPRATSRMRVQTVGQGPELFRGLLKAFGECTGTPVLVNTSFNGFHEPIVCTPRDAVRVFYGTGLDVAVIGNFLLRK